jgi:hypothetical protein
MKRLEGRAMWAFMISVKVFTAAAVLLCFEVFFEIGVLVRLELHSF